MSTEGTVLVLEPDPRGGWRVRRQSERLSVLRSVKKTDLVSRARRFAREINATLLIHRRDGSLEEEWVYPA
jgi:hypothetical protein